jgi:Protein of unknown function (DUF1236)
MNRILVTVVATAGILAGTQVYAQTVVEISPQQRTQIKEYVVKEKVRPAAIKERVTVGAALPADVELLPVPSAWGPSVSKYRYVYSDNHVLLVEPQDRKVVQIIE